MLVQCSAATVVTFNQITASAATKSSQIAPAEEEGIQSSDAQSQNSWCVFGGDRSRLFHLSENISTWIALSICLTASPTALWNCASKRAGLPLGQGCCNTCFFYLQRWMNHLQPMQPCLGWFFCCFLQSGGKKFISNPTLLSTIQQMA